MIQLDRALRLRPGRWPAAAAVVFLATVVLLGAGRPAARGGIPAPAAAAARLDPSRLALVFEPNVGQSPAGTPFSARAPGSTLFFTPAGVTLALAAGSNADGRAVAPGPRASATPTASAAPGAALVEMLFVGADPAVAITAGAAAPGKANYFLGTDPAAWHTDVPTYQEIHYRGLYPGIDLTYAGQGQHLKGTYTVAPGGDPGRIAWAYAGVHDAQVDDAGNLHLGYSSPAGTSGTLIETAPVAWQEIGGQRTPVAVRYVAASDGRVSFALGAYDPTQPLVIDPTLTYSTYLGGNFAEYGFGISADGAGNFYVAGMTNSANFPLVNPLQNSLRGSDDAWVAKFDAAGQPIYITYLGGSGSDWALDITNDSDGNAYLTGYTSSTNFPLANAYQPTYGGGFDDAFVTKINPTGSALVFSTYLGGSDVENAISRGSGSIAIDAARNVYVTGSTMSHNFPVRNPIQPNLVNIEDAFITKFNPAGSDLLWSTYLGGTRNDEPEGIGVDPQENVVIAGFTTSSDFPLANAYQPALRGTYDVFVSKINAAGTALVYSTYLGGTDYEYVDEATDVAVDPQGNAYVTGFTGSTNFPIAGPAFQPTYGGGVDGFVAKFTATGGLGYSTYLGGTSADDGESIAVNAAGEAFVLGSTQSPNFPTLNPLFPQLRGSEDATVTHLNAAGSGLIFSTYFGGSNNREMQARGALAVDAANTMYLTGNTEASDFPTSPDAYQPFRASVEDAFISRISESAPPPTPTPAGSATATPTVCAVSDYTVSASTGAAIVPGTTFLPNSTCNDCTAPLVLPFPVQFYDQTFTQARASSNGNLQFTSDNSLPFNSCLPNSTYNNVIYGYWDDLFLDCSGSGCGIYTSVSGVAPNRIFNIEWRAQRNEPPIVNVRFEIRLYEAGNGRFDLIYGPLDNPGNSATVGVQRDSGSRSTQYACNTGVLSQGLQLSFTLPPCNATPTPGGSTPTPTATSSPTPAPPALLYSTYYGSYERDTLQDIGQDAAGNLYVMGTTFQNDIDYGDIYIAKFSPDGHTLLYRTIFGGTRIDYGYGLSVDAAGNATAVGIATSFDYPVVNALQATHHGGIYDTVVTKLGPGGNILFSTYLGGSGADYASRVATDAAGNVYVVGHTASTNFPTTAGAYQPANRGSTDGFITKIAANGSAILWSTYLGGVYTDEVHDIALDGAGNLYLTGFAGSPDFPLLNAFQSTYYDGEAFVTKMNPQGSALLYSTYLGGNNPPGPGEDNGQGITVDASGSAYVTGYTQSPNFPTTPGAFQPFFRGYYDAFVTKLTPAGNALVYSTFVGGTLNPPYGDDEAFDIAVDGAGQAQITGRTNSPDFPIVRAVQPQKADVADAFVTKLNAAGSDLVYSTFLGGHFAPPDGNGEDSGQAILIDAAGNAVVGGGTGSFDFPIANAFQPENAGKSDGFISKIAGSAPLPTATATPTAGVPPSATPPRATPTATASVPPSATPPPAGTVPATLPPATPTAGPTAVATATYPPAPSATPGGATATPCAVAFSDVQPSDYFATPVHYLACQGVISGYADGSFRPYQQTTRGQMVKIVVLGFGRALVTPPAGGATFADVPPSQPFYAVIETAAADGIVSGYSCGGLGEPCDAQNRPYFRPYANVTRGQLSKIVVGAAGWALQNPAAPTFADVVAGSAFYPFVETAAGHGIISGYTCGGPGEPCDAQNRPYFRQANPATRGQIAKIVYGALAGTSR